MNGRTGQAQNGVDVFGRKDGKGNFKGVQCKGKDGRLGQAVTKTELRSEVKKALKFTPKIDEFILATTAASDQVIQTEARKLSKANEAKNLFSVHVMSWEEIQLRLADYPELIDKHFPGQGPTNHKTLALVQQLMNQLSQETETPSLQQSSLSSIPDQQTIIASADTESSPLDEILGKELDTYRDQIKNEPATALKLLNLMKDRVWSSATNSIKYRIKTNIAAAQLELADWSNAADNFIEAFDYAGSEDAKAQRNLAFALILKDQKKEACVEAQKAIELEPENADGYALYVSAVAGDVTKTPEELVPEEHHSVANVAYTIGHKYKSVGNIEKTIEWLGKALDADQNSFLYKASYASEIIEDVLSRTPENLPSFLSPNDLNLMHSGIQHLSEAWEEIRTSEVKDSYSWIGVNLCTALRIIDGEDQVDELLPELLELNDTPTDIIKMASLRRAEEGDFDDALHIISRVEFGKDEEIDLLHSDLLAQSGKWDDALKIVEQIKLPPEHKHRPGLEGFRLRLLAKVKGKECALKAIEDLENNFPAEILIHTATSKLFFELGMEEEGNFRMFEAISLISDESSIIERLTLADLLFDQERYFEATPLYQSLVNNYEDGHPVRRLLACQINADQRKGALQTLESVSAETRSIGFYRRCALTLYLNIPDYEKANEEINQYLREEPNDISARLNWIGLKQRLNQEDEIRDFLKTLDVEEALVNASPQELVRFSHLLGHYGQPQKGLDLAYLVRRNHPEHVDAHIGIIMLILATPIPMELLQKDKIDTNTAFSVKTEKDQERTYIIEDTFSDKRFSEEIPSKHVIAQAATGLSLGDEFEVSINPYQSEKLTITSIQSKYVYIHRITSEEFSTHFPDSNAFMRLDLATEEEGENFDFDPMFKVLDERHSSAKQIEDLYNSGPYPVSFISTMLGANPLEVWPSLMINEKIKGLTQITPFRCYNGSHEEKSFKSGKAGSSHGTFCCRDDGQMCRCTDWS